MADANKSVHENVEGEFFVDETCIDCDTCRQIAPATFADAGSYSFVHTQPQSAEQEREALHALLSCPTGSIGTRTKRNLSSTQGDFPLKIQANIYYCGFNSRKSYGANSYFIEHPAGNWLVDSPRYTQSLVDVFAARGGLKYIFLSHRDDVADANKFASRFGAQRIIHRRDLSAMPDCEIVIDGDEDVVMGEFVVIQQPGHTQGHQVLLYANKYLFTGDHLYVNRVTGQPDAFREHCWYSWKVQAESMERLSKYTFEWILPGHGSRGHVDQAQMPAAIKALVARMRSPQ